MSNKTVKGVNKNSNQNLIVEMVDNKEVISSVNTLDFYIDSDIELMKEHLFDKNLGYLLSFKNSLVMTFAHVDKVKTELVKMTAEQGITDPLSKEMQTIKALYVKIVSIENRVLYITGLIDSKSI